MPIWLLLAALAGPSRALERAVRVVEAPVTLRAAYGGASLQFAAPILPTSVVPAVKVEPAQLKADTLATVQQTVEALPKPGQPQGPKAGDPIDALYDGGGNNISAVSPVEASAPALTTPELVHRCWQLAQRSGSSTRFGASDKNPNIRWVPIEQISPEASPELHPERTAIARDGPSIPTRLAKPLIAGTVLDYGAGRGADSDYLRSKGLDVVSYDPHFFPRKPAKDAKFGWVLLNYVLNVIPSKAERTRVLEDVRRHLAPGGRAVVAVRTAQDVEENKAKGWKRLNDGWVTPNQTFQHGYAPGELEASLARSGLTAVKTLNDWTVLAARKADETISFGKNLPQAVYLHHSLMDALPPKTLARVKEAAALLPKSARWTLIKLASDGKAVSFLWYPNFDGDPHPALRRAYLVRYGKVRETDYSRSKNPFILHRKETFVAPAYPGFAKFKAQTDKEEAAGLLSRPDIGTLDGWKRALKRR